MTGYDNSLFSRVIHEALQSPFIAVQEWAGQVGKDFTPPSIWVAMAVFINASHQGLETKRRRRGKRRRMRRGYGWEAGEGEEVGRWIGGGERGGGMSDSIYIY